MLCSVRVLENGGFFFKQVSQILCLCIATRPERLHWIEGHPISSAKAFLSTQRSLRSRPGIWRQCYSPLVRRSPDVDAETYSGRGHQRATPRYFLKLCFHDQADRFAAISYEGAAPANIRPLARRHGLFLGQSRCHRGALVVETTPLSLGVIDDIWFRWATGFGLPGQRNPSAGEK